MNNIKALRLAADLTQTELANKVGTSFQQIQKLESGDRRLTQDWMIRLAKALGCAPIDLIESIKDTKSTHSDDVIWHIVGLVIELARSHPRLDQRQLKTIAKALYSQARSGILPSMKKGKANERSLTRALRNEAIRLVEYEAARKT